MFYKPLENLNQEDTVTFNSIGEEEQGKFGPQRQCEVSVNGEGMTWSLSQAKYKQLTDAGFKQGDTVKIQKWKEGMKKGYNFVSGSRNPYESSQEAANEVFAPVKKEVVSLPDDAQERITLGMSGNQAASILAFWAADKTDEEIVARWKSLKQKFYDENK